MAQGRTVGRDGVARGGTVWTEEEGPRTGRLGGTGLPKAGLLGRTGGGEVLRRKPWAGPLRCRPEGIGDVPGPESTTSPEAGRCRAIDMAAT